MNKNEETSEVQQWSDGKIALLIFIAGMILFTAGLSVYRFDDNTIRYAKYIQELPKHSLGWFPYLDGQPDHNTLVPHALLMYWSSQLFGGKINMFTTSLPSSIFAALSLMFIYLIGARERREIGLYAVLLTIGSYYFICQARTPCPAMFVVCAALFTYYLFIDNHKSVWRWSIMVLISLLGGVFYAAPGIGLIAAPPVSCIEKKPFKNNRYANAVCIAFIPIVIYAMYYISKWAYLQTVSNPFWRLSFNSFLRPHIYDVLQLFILTLIPFFALILGKSFWNQNNLQWIDKVKNNIFKILPVIPFILTVAWWIICYKLSLDKSLPPLPVMVPSMILLVCGMGMFAAKDLKKSTRELVLTAALVMSIYTIKIMIIDPIDMAYANKNTEKIQNVK
jgi:hypothetical protein